MLKLDTIHRGDSIKLLDDHEPQWVDLVFADPPFNIGYRYHGYDDRKGVDEYLQWSEKWMRSVHRALKDSGSFYLAIGDEFAADLCVIARRTIGFHLRNWIIWHYTFGQQTKKKFAKSHTHILYFTKSGDESGKPGRFTFNADAVRVASARQTTYADSRANPKGKLPDDVWFLRPQETAYIEPGFSDFASDQSDVSRDAMIPVQLFDPTRDTWYISRICGTFLEREGWHGCQMPLAVLNRIILASSNPGDIVLDPFNGSGTTTVSAALLKRRFVGIDQSTQYVEFARKRIAHALSTAKRSTAARGDRPGASKEKVDELVQAVVSDGARKSRKLMETDALGRPRVRRKRAGKSALRAS